VDDLLDYIGDASVTGKPTGSDLREHKVTLPLIAALPRMGDDDRRRVADLLLAPEPTDEQIHAVVESVAEAGGLDYARERAIRYASRTAIRLSSDTCSPTGPNVKLTTSRSAETGPNWAVQVVVKKVRAALSGRVCLRRAVSAPPATKPAIRTPR
jgi:hypothetical protein